ncbi:MAG: HU family DNA-binding protein [Desulfatiglans sp.]|jgi:DNA-binding protein HU-beta|nr:HU family DNA-binding protein [Thermodesulfobacteriota bacterium]MEE4352158.1 HU family DNA-binding protein [Desulfatiglans sp.]
MDQFQDAFCEIRYCPSCGTEIFCKTDNNDMTLYYISDDLGAAIQACPGCRFNLLEIPIHALDGPSKPVEGKRQTAGNKPAGIDHLTDSLHQKSRDAFPTKRAAKSAITLVAETLFDFLSDGVDVRLSSLGSFKIKERKPRKGKNPRTGEEIDIPASKGIRFVPSKALREKLNS